MRDLLARAGCFVCVLIFTLPCSAAAKERRFLVTPVQHGRRVPAQVLATPGARALADYDAMQAIAVPEAARDRVAQMLRDAGFEVEDLADLIRTPRVLIRTDVDQAPAAPFAAGLFVVQFSAPATPAWQAFLRMSGVVVVESLPERSVVISATTAEAATLAKLPWVQYVAPYLSEYKFHPVAPDGQTEFIVTVADTPLSAAALRTIREGVGGFVTETRYGAQVTARISTTMTLASSLLDNPFVLGVEAYLPPELSDERQAMALNGKASPAAAGRYLAFLAARGITPDLLTASGIVVDIADTGVDHGCNYTNASPDLKGRFVFHQGTVLAANATFKDDNGHGTVVAGIVGGNPLAGKNIEGGPETGTGYQHSDSYGAFYPGLGVAPGVRLTSTKIIRELFPAVGTVADWTRRAVTRPCSTTIATPCPASGPFSCPATVQNHSNNEYDATGSKAGVYSTNAREFDISVRKADRNAATTTSLAITVSAGNYAQRPGDNTTMVLPAATAKNVISVGAVESVRQGIPQDCLNETVSGGNQALRHSAQGYNVLAYLSRRGTTDRRFKPDLLAAGTLVVGPHASGIFQYFCDKIGPDGGGQFWYHGASGTSFTAPVAAGAVALLRYHYTTQYGFTPSPAMYKAMLVAGARSITGATDRLGTALGTTPTVVAWPNEQQGFGVINMSDLLDTAAVKSWHDQQTVLLQGQKFERNVVVADPTKPVRVVLVYTDAPGAVQDPTNPQYYAAAVNGLTLTGYPGNIRMYGNYTDASGYSISDTVGCGRPACPSGGDSVNNVEVLNIHPSRFTDPANRTFLVRVMASPINGIGVPGVSGGANNQDFALFVLNGWLQ
jgi:hypothetical protein